MTNNERMHTYTIHAKTGNVVTFGESTRFLVVTVCFLFWNTILAVLPYIVCKVGLTEVTLFFSKI